MEITIGIQNAPRELAIESDLSLEEVTKAVNEGLAGEALVLDDNKGRRVVVPSAAVAYVELGSDTAHPVGFVR